MSFHEHHYRNLGRARDHLTETIVSLRSAVDKMTGDDWIDATALLHDISLDIAPRLGRLRTAASERFDEHARRVEFDAMRYGELPFPDERILVDAKDAATNPKVTSEAPRPPRLDAPNAKVGAALVAKHGGVEQATLAHEPDSPEFDHVQAYRYVTTGRRPKGWIPPIA
jgi:hypothetical protein